MSADDGHGPKYGCTYQKCGNTDSPNPCPFVKDVHDGNTGHIHIPDVTPEHLLANSPLAKTCEHEWREFNGQDMSFEWREFYCIYCLTTKNLLDHNS